MAGYISLPRNSRLAGLALVAMGLAHAADTSVPALKYWSVGPILRISLDVDGAFKYKASRLNTPERIFFDVSGHAILKDRKMHTIQVGEPLLKQIRVAETNGVTRIVLDLPEATTPVEFAVSQLRSPDRLMIELSSKIGRAHV